MKYNLDGKIVVITGGCGLLGRQYVNAVMEIGGTPWVLDTKELDLPLPCPWISCDITQEQHLLESLAIMKKYHKPIYGLINNAAIDPKFGQGQLLDASKSRLEGYPEAQWHKELAVGLTGAFLCTKIFGSEIAKNGGGSIINISSVLGHVAPNQELYKKEGVDEEFQPVKPVTYSVIKHGIIGLTRYTATYWAAKGVRCNAISPGGVFNGHSDDFVHKLSKYIPLGRMAEKTEYNEAVKFLLTDASSFMTGAVMNVDGGMSSW